MFFDNFGQMNYSEGDISSYYYSYLYQQNQNLMSATSFPIVTHENQNRSLPSEKKGVQEFKCRSCNKYFKTKATADSHYKNIHENPTKVNCPKCGQLFSNKYILKKHSVKNHPPKAEIS